MMSAPTGVPPQRSSLFSCGSSFGSPGPRRYEFDANELLVVIVRTLGPQPQPTLERLPVSCRAARGAGGAGGGDYCWGNDCSRCLVKRATEVATRFLPDQIRLADGSGRMSEAYFRDRYFGTYAAPREPPGGFDEDRPLGAADRVVPPPQAELPEGVQEGFELMREMLSLLPADRPSAEACLCVSFRAASHTLCIISRHPTTPLHILTPAGATPFSRGCQLQT